MHTRALLIGTLAGLFAAGCSNSSSQDQTGNGSSSGGSSSSSSSSSSGGSSSSSGSSSGGSSGGGSTANLTFQVGCNWFPAFNAQNNNSVFPETSASYWIAVGPSSPTSDMQLNIAGNYLDARYFSLHVYDGTGEAEDHLPDYQIVPDAGSQNTFSAATQRSGAAPGGSYSAHLVFGAAPAIRATNTLYRGTNPILSSTLKQRTYLLLRVYVPADGAGADGGYNLPQLVLHSASGDVPLSQTPDSANCQALYNGYVQSSSTHPTLVPATPQNPPAFQSYRGNILSKGVFRNDDIAYVFATTTLNDGQVQLVRGQAPSFTDQSGGPVAPQLRYWSICQNDYNTETVSACLTDRDAVLDSSGYYTVVISDPATRPANATTANGFNFLPYGTDADPGAIILRNMLPNADFTQAAQNVPAGGSPASSMGNYAPVGTYCSQAVFEAAMGQTPAAVFSACQAASGLLP